MPPKKPAVVSPVSSSSDSPPQEEKKKLAKKAVDSAARKGATHPSTAVMVNEALKELDSRKGVSFKGIQGYIQRAYPSVDIMRMKTFVRKALVKGLESGAMVRPASSSTTTGAQGRFRLAPKKAKEAKAKTENTDPNTQKPPKADQSGAKKPQKKDASKQKEPSNTTEESKPPKKVKADKGGAAVAPKAAPAKKPKVKKAVKAEEGAPNFLEEEEAKKAPKKRVKKAAA